MSRAGSRRETVRIRFTEPRAHSCDSKDEDALKFANCSLHIYPYNGFSDGQGGTESCGW